MIRKADNAMKVSEYLDGKLSSRDLAAFESRMAQDPALRRRVEETRQVVAMVRDTPLRETPRNYLISPAMVAKATPQKAPRRPALIAMRLVTSLAALAFAITSGLALLQRGPHLAGMVATSSEPPQVALMQEKVVATTEVEAELAAPVEATANAAIAEEDGAALNAAETEITALAVPAPEVASAPQLGAVEEDTAAGMGSGGEPAVEEPAARIAVPSPAATPEGMDYSLAEEAQANDEAIEAPAETSTEVPALEAEEAAPEGEAADLGQTADATRQGVASSTWLAMGLGLATILLAVVTFWLSRRHPG